MRLVLRSVLRDLRAAWGRALAVALLIAAGVAIFTGLYAAIDSLPATRDHLYAEGRMADLTITFVPEDAANVPDLAAVRGVEAVEARLVLPGNIPLPGGRRLPALAYFLDPGRKPAVNRLTLQAGRWPRPGRPHEALIDRSLTLYHGVRPGDPMEVRVGHKRYRLTVAGVVASPEFLLAAASGDFLVPGKGSLGVVYLSNRLMEESMGFTLLDNVAVTFAPGADPAAARAAVERALTRHVTIEEVTPRSRQLGERFLRLDLQSFSQYVPAIIVVFAMVAALAVLLTVSRLVHGRRREIGTLLALGFSPRQIGLAHMVALLAVGAAGVAIGLAGAFGLRNLFLLDYSHAIGLPRVDRLMPAGRVLAGAAGGIAIVLAATAIPLSRILRMSPVEAIRPAPGGQQGARFAAFGHLLDGLTAPFTRSLPVRFAVRNLRRHALLGLTSVACMGLSLAVAVAYFLSMSSMDGAIDRYLGGARWDAAVDLAAPLWPEDVEAIAALPAIAQVEPQVKGQVRLTVPASGAAVDSTLTGVAPGARLWSYPSGQGKTVGEIGAGEVVLETVVARKLGVGVGDRIEVGHRDRTERAIVAGIGAGLSGEASFASLEFARRILDLEEMTTALTVRFQGGASRGAATAALYDQPDVARVTLRRNVSAAFHAIMEEIWGIVYIAAALAIGVAILFVLTSLTLSVLEREGELATLEALGFGKRVLRRMLVTEAVLQMAAAVVLAAPVAWIIAGYLNGRMSRVWFDVTTSGRPLDFIAVLAPALVLSPLAALPGLARVFHIDIGETVRQKAAD